MGCKHWNPEWVARLYDELDEAELGRATEHLARCADCRAQMDGLAASRKLLRESAPEVPAIPRVVVMPAAHTRHPAWAFAAGVGLAASLFVGGWFLGVRDTGATDDPATLAALEELRSRPTHEEMESALAAQQTWFEQRLAEAGRATTPPESAAMPAVMTRDQVDSELHRLERKIKLDRARDFEFLMGEIAATERRAGTWVDETRNALRYVALQNDPRLRER